MLQEVTSVHRWCRKVLKDSSKKSWNFTRCHKLKRVDQMKLFCSLQVLPEFPHIVVSLEKRTCREASLLKRKMNCLKKGKKKKGFRSQFQIQSWFELYLSTFQMSDFGPKGFMNCGTAGTSPHPGVHFTLEKQRTPSPHVCEKLFKKTNKKNRLSFDTILKAAHL